MRKGFATLPTETVTLTRGDDSVSLTLTAPPAGFVTLLDGRFPRHHYVKSKQTDLDAAALTERNDLFAYALLGVGLRNDDALDAVQPKITAPTAAWSAYSKQIRGEMSDANLTEAEVTHLIRTVQRLAGECSVKTEAEDALGN